MQWPCLRWGSCLTKLSTASWPSWRRWDCNAKFFLVCLRSNLAQFCPLLFGTNRIPTNHLCTNDVCFSQVESTAEGEAQRYFDHALTLKNTILFLRYNKELTQDQGPDIPNIGNQAVTSSIQLFFAYLKLWHHKSNLCMSIDLENGQLAGHIWL